MLDVNLQIAKVSQQANEQTREQLSVQRHQETMTSRLQIIAADLQASRAEKNVFRKDMDAILADAMMTLKKTSDQIKQATGG